MNEDRKNAHHKKCSPEYPPTNARPQRAAEKARARCNCCLRHFRTNEVHLRVFSHVLRLEQIEKGMEGMGLGVTRICIPCASGEKAGYAHVENRDIQHGLSTAQTLPEVDDQ